MRPERIEAYINPVMLKWARESLGLSLEDAASKLRVNPRKLQQCEKGRARLTFHQLITASNVYKRPVATFYLAEPPQEFEIPDFRRLPQSQDSTLSPELRLAIRRIHYQKQVAEQLANGGNSHDWGFIGSVKIDDDPENVAQWIREYLKITPDLQGKWKDDFHAFNGWRLAIENSDILVFLVPKVSVEEMRGFSIPNPPFPAIALNRKDSPAARSFSIHHEFCHILLNEPGLCEPLAVMHNGTQEQNVEMFCNHVAGAVLVPPLELQRNATVVQHENGLDWKDEEIAQIARKFRVSKEVALRRLATLGLASSDNYTDLVRLWKTRTLPPPEEQGFAETGSQKILRLQGKAYVNLILEAYREEKITERDISDYLNMKLKYLDSLQETLT